MASIKRDDNLLELFKKLAKNIKALITDSKKLDDSITALDRVAMKKLNVDRNGFTYAFGLIRIAGVSLNTIDESGMYYCDNTPNRPVSGNGYMQAFTRAGDVRGLQFYYPEAGGAWRRIKISDNDWSAWTQT